MSQNSLAKKSLLAELGLDDLPRDKQEQLIIRLTEVILKKIFLETMEKLDEAGREEYEKLITNGASPEQLENFLNSKIENYDLLVEKAVDDFREQMKNEEKRF